MQADDAKGVGEVIAVTEEAGCGRDVGKIVEVDCGGRKMVF